MSLKVSLCHFNAVFMAENGVLSVEDSIATRWCVVSSPSRLAAQTNVVEPSGRSWIRVGRCWQCSVNEEY